VVTIFASRHRMAIGHAGDEQAKLDPTRDPGQEAKSRVTLEHRIEGRAHLLHLEVLIHQREVAAPPSSAASPPRPGPEQTRRSRQDD